MINNKKVERKRIIQRFKLHFMLIDWWWILIGLDNAYKIFRTPKTSRFWRWWHI
nr:hypothetical protein [Mycoplasmopsis bovis]